MRKKVIHKSFRIKMYQFLSISVLISRSSSQGIIFERSTNRCSEQLISNKSLKFFAASDSTTMATFLSVFTFHFHSRIEVGTTKRYKVSRT